MIPFNLLSLSEGPTEYRTFYNEGEITCRSLNNLITKIDGLDATECRRRCDHVKECQFFYSSHFAERTTCMIFRSCDHYQTMNGKRGTTYAKFRRGNEIKSKIDTCFQSN